MDKASNNIISGKSGPGAPKAIYLRETRTGMTKPPLIFIDEAHLVLQGRKPIRKPK